MYSGHRHLFGCHSEAQLNPAQTKRKHEKQIEEKRKLFSTSRMNFIVPQWQSYSLLLHAGRLRIRLPGMF